MLHKLVLVGLVTGVLGLSTVAATAAGVPCGIAPPDDVTKVAADDFMTIHLDNQKIGSAVSLYWQGMAEQVEIAASDNPYMLIHMSNQKVGSDVSAFWDALSCEVSGLVT